MIISVKQCRSVDGYLENVGLCMCAVWKVALVGALYVLFMAPSLFAAEQTHNTHKDSEHYHKNSVGLFLGNTCSQITTSHPGPSFALKTNDPMTKPSGASTKLSKPAFVGLIAGMASDTSGGHALRANAQYAPAVFAFLQYNPPTNPVIIPA